MTTDQATELMAYLIAAFPTAAAPPATCDLYLQHFEALPYERVRFAVSEVVLTHQYPSLPSIAEIVEAVGVGTGDARAQLREAMRDRKPLVRDAASVTGWSAGTAVMPPESMKPGVIYSLPAGPVVTEEKRQSLLVRLADFARALRAGDGS